MISVVCVLRGRGPYGVEDVLRLRAGVRRHLSMSHAFYCLSDLNGGGPNQVPPRMIAEGVRATRLSSDWPTWWAKLEIFKIKGPVLYLDLDTILVGSIDPLAEAVANLEAADFLMLRAFRNNKWASGVMGWASDYSWLEQEFSSSHPVFTRIGSLVRVRIGSRTYPGDQDWIRERLILRATAVVAAQDVCPGIYSYKRHIRNGPLPGDASIVCFHGRPRPAEIDPAPAWLNRGEVLT